MAAKLPWSPWREVVKLREDVRTGASSLADFAADLNDVMMQKGARRPRAMCSSPRREACDVFGLKSDGVGH